VSAFEVPLQAFELGAHLRRALVAQVEIFFQRLFDDFFKFCEEPRAHFTRWAGHLVEDRFPKHRPRKVSSGVSIALG